MLKSQVVPRAIQKKEFLEKGTAKHIAAMDKCQSRLSIKKDITFV